MNKVSLIFLTLSIILFALIGWLLFKDFENRQTPLEPEGVACTMEAKICPDGSAVGRVAPTCEFAACPEIKPPITTKESVIEETATTTTPVGDITASST